MAIEQTTAQDTPVENAGIIEHLGRRYEAGFVTDIESDALPPGLGEDIVRALSAKKGEPEWMTQWRLDAYRHWLTMPVPHWAKLDIAPIDFQALSYYSAPKAKYATLDEVPQELLDTYEKLGVPLHERAKLAGVAVDAVFDSVSVGTTLPRYCLTSSGCSRIASDIEQKTMPLSASSLRNVVPTDTESNTASTATPASLARSCSGTPSFS